jgi:hypothetical protein
MNRRQISYWVLGGGLAALSAFGATAGPDGAGPAAAIETARSASSIQLSATVRNLKPGITGGRYEFEITKMGPSGQSTIRQGGAVPVASNGTGSTVLSASGVSLSEGDRLIAKLRVTVPGFGVLTDRVEVPSSE